MTAPVIAPRAPRWTTARTLLAWLAAACAALALLLPAAVSAAAVPSRAADSFVDSIGVNTHTYYNDTVYYTRFETVKQRLAELGVRNIRENLRTGRSDQYQRLNQLAAIGIKSTLILGDPRNGTSGLESLLGIVKKNLSGSVAALEGPNEYDNMGISNWLPELSSYQQRLYAAAKADPALSSLPVIGPSIVQWESMEDLGDISGQLDYGNIHSYPDGYAPEGNLSNHLGHAADNSGSKPVWATETGYHTALAWTGGHKPTSEAAMGVYMPRLFLEYFRRGVVKTFSYELLDEQPNSSDREDNFGLLRNDLSPKPAFDALRNTISILADPGSSFSPASLDYTLSGNQENLRQVLLQKRDGSFYLALWRTSSVWDPASKTTLSPSSPQVTLSVNRSLAAAARYEPNASATPVASISNPNSPITIAVGPKVTIVKLTPASGAAPAPSPAPEPSPAPAPAPTPAPEPTPAPAPEPAPAPTPTPAPSPSTEPAPSPAPAPAPAPAPTTPSAGKHKHHRDRLRARKGGTTARASASRRRASALAAGRSGH